MLCLQHVVVVAVVALQSHVFFSSSLRLAALSHGVSV